MDSVNPFLSLPDELVCTVVAFIFPYPRLGTFKSRMAIGLVDRSSYARFESIAHRELNRCLQWYTSIRKKGHLDNPIKRWERFWSSLSSLALSRDLYRHCIDAFLDENPPFERRLNEFKSTTGVVDLQSAPLICAVFSNIERLRVEERRLLSYHAISVADSNEREYALEVYRANPFTRSRCLCVYDETIVPKDATSYYRIAVVDEPTTILDVRGLRTCKVAAFHNQPHAESITNFIGSFGHYQRGNLYAVDWYIDFPLDVYYFMKAGRRREAFIACLERCHRAMFDT